MDELSYLAGIIDGEGCIGINKCNAPRLVNPRYVARISVGMTAKAPLDMLQKHFGGPMYLHANPSGNKPIWRWHLVGNKCTFRFLATMRHYLIVKRPQAEMVLQFISEFKSPYSKRKGNSKEEIQNRENFYLKLKALNSGAPATTERDDPATGCDSLTSQVTERGAVEVLPPPTEKIQ